MSKPYVAGYYAWSILGEELTREQVADRIEELLTLGKGCRGLRTGRRDEGG